MFRKFFYILVIFSITCNFSFSQKTTETITEQKGKQKTSAAAPETIDNIVKLIEGKVITVEQGDALVVETKDQGVFSILMQGIDAPESGQDFGEKSRKKLADLVSGKTVQAIVYKKYSNDRYLGTIYFDGKDVNLKQIQTGMAWHFTQSDFEQRVGDRQIYEQAEQKARAERIGLWSDKNPVAPWQYRADAVIRENSEKDTVKKPIVTPAVSDNTEVKTEAASGAKNPADKNRTYTRGPRGGCYYINSNGGKTYVDRNLCN